jgi:hypothetical protein
MKYRDFFAYWVMDEVKNGNTVYVLDRQTKTVEVVNEMTVDKAMAVINSAEADAKRYEFWCEEEENENA